MVRRNRRGGLSATPERPEPGLAKSIVVPINAKCMILLTSSSRFPGELSDGMNVES